MALIDNINAYWKLEDVNDSVASYNLTNNGTTSFNAALIGNGADGGTTNSTKRLTINSQLGMSAVSANISFSFWVKMNTEIGSGFQVLFERTIVEATLPLGYFIKYEYNGGTRRLAFYRARHGVVDNIAYYTITLGTTNWVHLAMTYDGTTLRGSVNGTEQTSVASSGAGLFDVNFVDRFAVLASDNGYSPVSYASSIVDEFGVWNKKLSTTEITELYNGGAGLQYPFVQTLVPSVSDTLSITESTTQFLFFNISVNDVLSITENITLSNTQLGNISVNDIISNTESVTQVLISNISVNDVLTIIENVSQILIYNISVNDITSITESTTQLLISDISINDTLSTTESTTLSNIQLGNISVNETLSITESATQTLISNISVDDSLIITEGSTIFETEEGGNPNVSDAITISESITMESFRFSTNMTIPYGSVHVFSPRGR